MKSNLAATAVLIILTMFFLIYARSGDSSGTAEQNGRQRPPTAVEVKGVQREGIARELKLVGETVALETVTIASQVDGIVAYCPWNPGDAVRDSNTELVRLERELYRVEVERADARVSELKAEAEFLHSNYIRAKRLYEKEVAGEESYERAKHDYAAREARLQGAKADLKYARARLAESISHAPFAGVISKVHVRRGDSIRAGQPLLEMLNLDSIIVRSSIPEADTGRVKKGMLAKMRFDSYPGELYAAEVQRLYPYLDPKYRTRTVELKLTPPVQAIVPGMFARIRLEIESAPDALTVPADAIIYTSDGKPAVFVAEDGKARKQVIETGLRQNNLIQVVRGLEETRQVVVSGADGLSDRENIRIIGDERKNPREE